ncbi:MAG: YciE/YciF ferroxidase family protein [Agriterribacter sp.]
MESYILEICTLGDLMHHGGRRLLSAEKQLENIIPLWIEATKSSSLVTALNTYVTLVRGNIKDLRQHLNEEGMGALSCTNRIMQDMILESRETMSNCTNAEVKQAALIFTVQSIIHYKAAVYNHLAACASIIAKPAAVQFFLRARLQEEDFAKNLSQIAAQAFDKSTINVAQPQKTNNGTKW